MKIKKDCQEIGHKKSKGGQIFKHCNIKDKFLTGKFSCEDCEDYNPYARSIIEKLRVMVWDYFG